MPSFRRIYFLDPFPNSKGNGVITPKPQGFRRIVLFRWFPYLIGRQIQFTVTWDPQDNKGDCPLTTEGIYEDFPPFKPSSERTPKKLRGNHEPIGRGKATVQYISSVIQNSGRCRITLSEPNTEESAELISFEPRADETMFFLIATVLVMVAAALLGGIAGAAITALVS